MANSEIQIGLKNDLNRRILLTETATGFYESKIANTNNFTKENALILGRKYMYYFFHLEILDKLARVDQVSEVQVGAWQKRIKDLRATMGDMEKGENSSLRTEIANRAAVLIGPEGSEDQKASGNLYKIAELLPIVSNRVRLPLYPWEEEWVEREHEAEIIRSCPEN